METTARKIAVLGMLYFAQGLPFGFFTQALPALLLEDGRSLTEVGLASLLAIAWGLKFLWAPLIDRYATKRLWIAILQPLTALLLFALAYFARGSLDVLLAAILVINFMNATQDIATDGLAVAILSEKERGFANGVQVGGYRVGMIIGGAALLVVFERTGWSATFAAMAALSLLATSAVLFVKEPRTRAPAQKIDLWSFFRLPNALRILALVVIYKAGEHFATGMLRPYLLKGLGLSLTDLASLLGQVGFAAGLLGALTGGAIAGRIGRLRALIIFGVLQTIAVASYAWLAAGDRPTNLELYAVCAFEHFAGGTATATLFTAMMDWSRPEKGASDYTIQASAVVIATFAANGLSGVSAQALGFAGHFALATVFTALAVVAAAALFPRTRNS
jgi:MFS transporter, PAT family, beta-lactamase induction signal transducer AmpG